MSKLKMALALVLVVAITAGAAIAGTLAYMTSEQAEVNVMTTGKVEIEQLEYERVTDDNGEYVLGVEDEDFTANYGITKSYKLQPFTQGKPAYPSFYTAGGMDWDEFQQLWNGVGAPGSNDLFNPSMTNVIDKFVFVKNTGSYDCYYRTLIAIERPDSVDSKMIHLNFNANDRFDAISGEGNDKSYYVGRVEIDGVMYSLYNMTYNQILEPNEISRPSLLQVYLDPKATNDDVAAFGEEWDIRVISQAVQADGGKNAQFALNTAFGEASLANCAEWFGGMQAKPFAKVTVLDADDTLTNADGDVTVLDENRTIDTTNSKMGLDLGQISLDTAYQFEPTLSAEDVKSSEYKTWHADFVVSVDKDIPAFGIGLAGYYDAWCSLNNDKWVMLASDAEIKAGEEIRLVKTMSDLMNMGITVSYKDLSDYGNDGIGFLCGAVDLSGEEVFGNTVEKIPAGTTLSVELRLYEATDGTEASETGEYITTGVYKYTFK